MSMINQTRNEKSEWADYDNIRRWYFFRRALKLWGINLQSKLLIYRHLIAFWSNKNTRVPQVVRDLSRPSFETKLSKQRLWVIQGKLRATLNFDCSWRCFFSLRLPGWQVCLLNFAPSLNPTKFIHYTLKVFYMLVRIHKVIGYAKIIRSLPLPVLNPLIEIVIS